MSDSKKCFGYLDDSIPQWLASLEEIGKRIADRQDEIARVPVPATPKKKKTGSMESLRPNDKDENELPSVAADPAPQQDELQHPNGSLRRYQTVPARRKRKTASILSAHGSGAANKYRSRSMIIVYYDSEVQKAFEALVRNIGTGRNLIRKGKMSARMEALTKDIPEDDDDDDPDLSQLTYRTTIKVAQFRSTRLGGMGAFSDCDRGTEQFDTADKALEKAQSLCERGAHQFLRDGDCRLEIDGCRDAFQEVLAIAQKELARMKEQEPQPISAAKSSPPRVKELRPDINPMRPGAIEVDDSGSDDIQLPTSIRLTSRRFR